MRLNSKKGEKIETHDSIEEWNFDGFLRHSGGRNEQRR